MTALLETAFAKVPSITVNLVNSKNAQKAVTVMEFVRKTAFVYVTMAGKVMRAIPYQNHKNCNTKRFQILPSV